MQCELCGAEGRLYKVKIEGSIMNVCEKCKRFGTPISTYHKPINYKKKKKTIEKPEIIEEIVPDYANLIREARESHKMKQDEFARKINEKDSIIHKIETGHFKPSLKLAKKIEKFFGIKLIQEIEDSDNKVKTSDDTGSGFTIGDFIKK